MMQRRELGRLLAVVLIGAALGCSVFGPLAVVPGRAGLFSHIKHLDEAELTCGDCHRKYEEEDAAGMPSVGQCRLCHDEADEGDLTPGRRVSDFYLDGELEWSAVTRLSADLRFSHRVHNEAEVECVACHGDVGATDGVSPRFRLQMADCQSCHAQQGIEDDCGICHTLIDSNWAPPNHQRSWREIHGSIVRAGVSADPNQQCSLCHDETTCIGCHMDEKPRNHTNFFRTRGHGVEARVDRQKCATCHQTDFCDRCHQETAPRSHTGRWGGPANFHCIGCHNSPGGSGCFFCHGGAPSHLLGTPKPANHNPGMNCRQCHGLSAPLPHVDNGDNCNDCHP